MKKILSLILIFLKDVMKITSLNRGLEWFHKDMRSFNDRLKDCKVDVFVLNLLGKM